MHTDPGVRIRVASAWFLLAAAEAAASAAASADLRDEFRDPPARFRILQIIHSVEADAPARAESLARAGFGGVVANVSFRDYLRSEEKWSLFTKGLQAFADRGLRLWLYDEKGYPSGKAGGLTLEGHPEHECLGVVMARTEGEGEIRHTLPKHARIIGDPLLAIAAPLREGAVAVDEARDLTAQAAGRSEIVFAAPAGRWVVASFHLRTLYEGTHIVSNFSDTLPYLDVMSPAAVRRFIEVTHEEYARRIARSAPDLWKRIEAIFTDEPSLMGAYLKREEGLLPVISWSRALPAERLRPLLPYLFLDAGPRTPYARIEFWRAASRAYEDAYFGAIDAWCRAHGIASTGHVLTEEHLRWHGPLEGDLYRDLRRMAIPGVDILTSDPETLARAPHIPIPKLASSAAHATGAERVMSESSAFIENQGKRSISVAQRFAATDWQYALGVTQITSYWSPAEFGDSLRSFNDHVGRLGVLLAGGSHVADVAVYYPIHTVHAETGGTDRLIWEPAPTERLRRAEAIFAGVSCALLNRQRDFDYLDDQAIEEAEARDGALRLRDEAYRAIVLAGAWAIPAATIERCLAFARAGGGVIIAGDAPEIGLTPEETPRVAEAVRALRAAGAATAPTAAEAVGAVAARIPTDVGLDPARSEIRVLHRRRDGLDVYFLANPLGQAYRGRATLRAAGTAERWDPTSGEIRAIQARQEAGMTAIEIEIGAYGSTFLVLRPR